jgi:hypothetical protein
MGRMTRSGAWLYCSTSTVRSPRASKPSRKTPWRATGCSIGVPEGVGMGAAALICYTVRWVLTISSVRPLVSPSATMLPRSMM